MITAIAMTEPVTGSDLVAISLDFRNYAATSSQARRRMVICWLVGGWGSYGRKLPAMITRRSLVNMSRTEDWALLVPDSGVPDDRQRVDDECERDRALHAGSPAGRTTPYKA
jgi:hypothetical protein